MRWTRIALQDFEQAQDYLMAEDPQAARLVARRIQEAIEHLKKFPRIGRVGEDEDTREWKVQKTPYLLIYSVADSAIVLLRVWHTARIHPQQEANSP